MARIAEGGETGVGVGISVSGDQPSSAVMASAWLDGDRISGIFAHLCRNAEIIGIFDAVAAASSPA